MTKLQQEIFAQCPADVRARAIDLTTQGVSEYAYQIRDCQVVVEVIRRSQWTLLGGDLWRRRTDGVMQPAGENWYVDRGEDRAKQREKAVRRAGTFLRQYADESDAYMTFVVSDY